MTHPLEIARHDLLEPAGLTDQQLQTVLDQVMGHQVDSADLYFQSIYHEAWSLEEGIVKGGSYDIDRGVGVRAISGTKTGFAYSDDILLPALTQAATAARSIAGRGQPHALKSCHPHQGRDLYLPVNPLQSIGELEKIAVLHAIDQAARREDPRVTQVMVSLVASYETILIVTSNGELAADVRPLVRVNVNVVVEEKGQRETGYAGGGGRYGYDVLLAEEKGLQFAREAVRQALVSLKAKHAPAGVMPVVLGSGWPGILLHEAIGHGLEADFNRKGTSAFTGRLGQRVATPLCTIVDDGTLKGLRGSLNVDDEGTPTECTVLIEKGILKNYIQDKQNAKLMGMKLTGNGRRESYAHVPMPRMTNTYMLAGASEPEEIIASVKKGLYAVNFEGGEVDITSGKFVFSTSEAYLIENGKITAPVKGATLIGHGPDVLTKVSMVGNDLALDSGVGTCGKDGQSVPVGVGQPTLKVDALTVGGTI